MTTPNGMSQKTIDRVTYELLPAHRVRDHVVSVCEKEWDASDFPKYGDDLYNSKWALEEIEIDKILLNEALLKSDFFQQDLQPRVKRQRELYSTNQPIPPLILRGSDLLIFDGCARYHFLRELGATRSLAYVGHK